MGFIYDHSDATSFYPNKKQKYMWHFWGKSEELQGPLKVTGSNEAGEHITVFEAKGVGGPNNGADAHMPSLMSLPTPGYWRLDAYFGEKLFGSVVVIVNEKK
ncbi:hypothetical protein [Paenibacillus phytorum]|uniref:hypothetical protein n=1 Tax=Paenibacillus phytorum TaxID=2654977 RepID=UPI001FE39A65|nr:hypothetical protein [Paenibacillus phytorum]